MELSSIAPSEQLARTHSFGALSDTAPAAAPTPIEYLRQGDNHLCRASSSPRYPVPHRTLALTLNAKARTRNPNPDPSPKPQQEPNPYTLRARWPARAARAAFLHSGNANKKNQAS